MDTIVMLLGLSIVWCVIMGFIRMNVEKRHVKVVQQGIIVHLKVVG